MNIYKYTPLRSAFFENFQLRACRREDLNDPFEILPSNEAWVDYYSNTGNLSQHPDPEEHARDLIKKTDFLQAQNQDFPLFSNTGVISFTGNIDSILMWSHYADSHAGMRLEFDKTHEFFHGSKPYDAYTGKLHPVVYSQGRPKDIRISGKEIFTTKSKKDWEYENEFRLIVDLEDSDICYKDKPCKNIVFKRDVLKHPHESNLFFMFRIPQEALISVAFGVKSDEALVSQVVDLIRSNSRLHHLRLFHTRPSPDQYAVEYEEFKM